jgi:hypothetical protein
MLVVVCCVCVLCVVVVTSPFSYLTGGNEKIGPSKMADESALITKNASLDAPNVKGCSKSSLSVDFEHVLTFGLKRDIGALCAEKVCCFLSR